LSLVEDLHWLIPKINTTENISYPIFAQYSYDKNNKLLIDSE